jgi:hypothetical protein
VEWPEATCCGVEALKMRRRRIRRDTGAVTVVSAPVQVSKKPEKCQQIP